MTQPSRLSQSDFNPARFELLLQACFLPDQNAIVAFEQWNAYNDWDDNFNTDEYRLFPQLYRNLSALGFDHPLMAKFKGIARKAWYNNNLFFHNIAPTIQNLSASGVSILLLSGAAFALRYYNDHVLAHTPGFGILVHPATARAAFQHLTDAGWRPQPQVPANVLDAYLTASYFHIFQNDKGERIFVQWQLLPACPAKNSDAPFWERAQEISIDGVPALILDPTDQLLQTCVLGSIPGGTARPQRASDAMLLLNAAANEIDWNALLARIQTNHVVLPVREMLLSLAAQFKTPVPAPILEKLKALSVTSEEQKNRTLWDAVTPNERADRLWRIYVRRSCNKNAAALTTGFPTFLQHWWGLETLGQLPPRALSAFRWQRLARE